MRLFGNTRQRNKLRAQRQAALDKGDPELLAKIAKSFIGLGYPSDAYETAEEGLRLFPACEALKSVVRFAAKERAPDLLKEARRQVENDATPESFIDLARAHRALGDEEVAIQTLEKAIDKYPTHGRPKAELAKIFEERYYEDLAALDARRALTYFEDAVEADIHNAQMRFDMALLLYRVGETLKCRSLLRACTEMDVFNLEAGRLFRQLCSESVETNDIDVLLNDIEETGKLVRIYPANFSAGGSKRAGVPESVLLNLDQLNQSDAIDEVVVLEDAGTLEEDCTEFAQLISELSISAGVATRRLSLGAMTSCVVEGSESHVMIRRIGSGFLGVCSNTKVSAVRLGRAVRQYLERTVPAGWGDNG